MLKIGKEFGYAGWRSAIIRLAREVVRCGALARRYPIVWMTGRPEPTREETSAWLRHRGLPNGRLLMHPDRSVDARPSRVIKREQVVALRAGGEDVVVVVDDDPRVVDELRDEGVHCLLATWSPYSPTYQDLTPEQTPPR